MRSLSARERGRLEQEAKIVCKNYIYLQLQLDRFDLHSIGRLATWRLLFSLDKSCKCFSSRASIRTFDLSDSVCTSSTFSSCSQMQPPSLPLYFIPLWAASGD